MILSVWGLLTKLFIVLGMYNFDFRLMLWADVTEDSADIYDDYDEPEL